MAKIRGTVAYFIGDVRYLTSGQVAKRLGINQRTVIRWTKLSKRANPTRRALLAQLRFVQDPISRIHYFEESCILELEKIALKKRPIRRLVR